MRFWKDFNTVRFTVTDDQRISSAVQISFKIQMLFIYVLIGILYNICYYSIAPCTKASKYYLKMIHRNENLMFDFVMIYYLDVLPEYIRQYKYSKDFSELEVYNNITKVLNQYFTLYEI